MKKKIKKKEFLIIEFFCSIIEILNFNRNNNNNNNNNNNKAFDMKKK